MERIDQIYEVAIAIRKSGDAVEIVIKIQKGTWGPVEQETPEPLKPPNSRH